MTDIVLFNAAMFLYLFVSLVFLIGMLFNRSVAFTWGHRLAWLGFGIHTAAIVFRWILSLRIRDGHMPVINTYESMVFFSWSIVLFYLLFEKRFTMRKIGAPIFILGFLGIAVVSLSPSISKDINPLVPALQSFWLTIHVVTCFIAYGAFAITFCTSVAYLLSSRLPERTIIKRFPPNEQLDNLGYHAVTIGFIFLSLGIITGAIWAQRAWGRYWGWDPKETWALITWFIYAAFLHARVTAGWRGARMAILGICGFISVIFTYWGVNFLLSGLHSYL